HPVLRDEHKRGKKNGFHRRHHGQDDKGGIELGEEGNPTQVDDDPQAEDNEMEINKQHAARESSDGIRDAVLQAAGFFLGLTALKQRMDIALDHTGHVCICIGVTIRMPALLQSVWGPHKRSPAKTSTMFRWMAR